VPGVLFPHGHFNDGRFIDIGHTAVRKEIVIGSERFESGGRSLLQALPVQCARMGCICFHYDMIGYADSIQLGDDAKKAFELAHRFAKQRPELNTTSDWGLFSPQAEAHLQSIMGLQTWNSIRALDFLLSLSEIDSTRIAVTGASGGGTQTMLLAAVDPRVTVSFPAVMVSTAMQGGCTCENACCLRVDAGNIEFAGLFAPKPQGMTAANDWTKEMATKGFPELKQLYTLLGAPRNVELFANTHFQHNYNYVSRACFFGFINKHFKLGLEEPVVEEDFDRLTREQMTVWDAAHPLPEHGEAYERKLCRQLAEASQKQIDGLVPKDVASLAKWRDVVGGAFESIIGGDLPAKGDLEITEQQVQEEKTYKRYTGLLKIKSRGEELPAVLFHPSNWNGRAVIWLSERGKASLFGDNGAPAEEIKRLLDAGIAVFGVDLLFQGEFLPQDEPTTKNREVEMRNPRHFAGYTYGYNYTLLAQRAHDVLSMISFVKTNHLEPKTVELVAVDGCGPIAAAALARCGGTVTRAAVATRSFRFGKLTDYLDANFLPGGAKYGDLPGLLSLAAPTKLLVTGETADSAAVAKKVYAAAGASDAITFDTSQPDQARRAAVEWLIKAQ
jgi:dienelactone hydrolase